MAKIVKVLVAGEEFQFTPTETDDYSKLDVQSLLDRIQRHKNGEEIPGLKKFTLSEEGKAILAAAAGKKDTDSGSNGLVTAGLLGALGFILFKPGS